MPCRLTHLPTGLGWGSEPERAVRVAAQPTASLATTRQFGELADHWMAPFEMPGTASKVSARPAFGPNAPQPDRGLIAPEVALRHGSPLTGPGGTDTLLDLAGRLPPAMLGRDPRNGTCCGREISLELDNVGWPNEYDALRDAYEETNREVPWGTRDGLVVGLLRSRIWAGVFYMKLIETCASRECNLAIAQRFIDCIVVQSTVAERVCAINRQDCHDAFHAPCDDGAWATQCETIYMPGRRSPFSADGRLRCGTYCTARWFAGHCIPTAVP